MICTNVVMAFLFVNVHIDIYHMFLCLWSEISLFHELIITDSVVLWKIQKFDWLIPETK